MSQTIAEKILSKHSGKEAYAGEIIVADVDYAMSQDGTTPLAIRAFTNMGIRKVWDSKRISFVIDHSVPSPSESVSQLHDMMRDFASKHNINLYDAGCGVCHQLLPEQGHVVPGDLVVGADSHTCTYGALNAFSTGIGSTDMAAVYASGKLWFKVPESLKIIVNGQLPERVYSKDLILKIIGLLSADGATYMSAEFTGDTIDGLSIEARMTVTNMAVEMGAKTGIMDADRKVLDYVSKSSSRKPAPVKSDKDAVYADTFEFDASDIEPLIAKPHRVDNVCPVSEVAGTPIHEAFIGTCTNGRLEDLRVAADILKNRKVKEGVKLIVAPASKQIHSDAMDRGFIKTLLDAGATVFMPGCGPCVGTQKGVPEDNWNVISTANRNFKGRMGNNKAFIYLGSPATVAASALRGEITDPREF